MILKFGVAIAIAILTLSLVAGTSMAEELTQEAEQLKAALAQYPVQVTQQENSVTLASSADAMFPSGGWQIPSDAPLLNRMLPMLSQLKNTNIVVSGYTDNVPIGSQLQPTISDNLDLSAKRALSVANYLISHGVKPDLISAHAFGETRPVASNDTPEGRAKNRRIDITLIAMAAPSVARADEATTKSLLKAMSDYMAGQKAVSFAFDTTLEIVTKDKQKLGLASSGTVLLNRPNKIRFTRHGGFADVEAVFDGKTLSLLGKNAIVYGQADVPGSIDHLVDELRDKIHRPVSGADLLMSDIYDQLMPEVTEAKDLGSGVIGGVECDHLAFRTKDVDWEIWIAQGARPYPCRYVVTSKLVEAAPQYSVQLRDFRTGSEVASDDFSFAVPANAKKIDLSDLDVDELPKIFAVGGSK